MAARRVNVLSNALPAEEELLSLAEVATLHHTHIDALREIRYRLCVFMDSTRGASLIDVHNTLAEHVKNGDVNKGLIRGHFDACREYFR